MRLIIQPSYELVSKWTANYVTTKIKEFNPNSKKLFVMGLPTGFSPIGMYKELIKLYKRGYVSFKCVKTFNMDEYVGLPEDHPESYHSFMWNNLFSHIDIEKANVNTVLDAEEVLIIISGHSKAHALAKVVEEGVNHMWTVSALQMHPKGMIVCDEDSTSELKVGTVKYFKDIEAKHLEPRTQLLRKKK